VRTKEEEDDENNTPESANLNCWHGSVPSPSEALDLEHLSIARRPAQGQKMRFEEEEEEEDSDNDTLRSTIHWHGRVSSPSECYDRGKGSS